MMLYCGLLAAPVFGADNGLALTPPMGWRSWNCYRGDDSAYVALQCAVRGGVHVGVVRLAISCLCLSPFSFPPTGDVNDPKIRKVVDGVVARTNTVDGKPTSLLDLGYPRRRQRR